MLNELNPPPDFPQKKAKAFERIFICILVTTALAAPGILLIYFQGRYGSGIEQVMYVTLGGFLILLAFLVYRFLGVFFVKAYARFSLPVPTTEQFTHFLLLNSEKQEYQISITWFSDRDKADDLSRNKLMTPAKAVLFAEAAKRQTEISTEEAKPIIDAAIEASGKELGIEVMRLYVTFSGKPTFFHRELDRIASEYEDSTKRLKAKAHKALGSDLTL